MGVARWGGDDLAVFFGKISVIVFGIGKQNG